MHVSSLSEATGRALPLWAWKQYVEWQDLHIEAYAKTAKQGVHCVRC